jgi:hypothetical protein
MRRSKRGRRVTVETDLDRAQYATNATTGPWTVPFYFLVNSELAVTYTDAAGVDTLLGLDIDYAVVGAGDEDGGTITTTQAYPAGGQLVILRDMQFVQETVYVEGESFPAKTHERNLDRLTMIVQQLREMVGRAISFPSSDAAAALLPSVGVRENLLLGFGPTGTLALYPTTYVPGLALRGFIDVTTLGAKNDGLQASARSNSAAINAAIAALSTQGGGILFFPNGTFYVGSAGIFEAINLLSNVTLMGAGKDATIIKLADGENDDVINMAGVFTVCIRDMTIDGNRLNQTAGVHGIRSAGASNLLISNVKVQNTNSYGIGLEVGNQIRVRIANVDITGTSDDGIDIKNPNSLNDEIMIENLTVSNYGLGGFTGQTGVDIRGPASLSGIWIRNVLASNVGVRMRNKGPATGEGGRRSSLTNFDIQCDSNSGTIALAIVADDVSVSNGYINGALYGIETIALNTRVTNVTAENCTGEAFRSSTATGDFGETLRGSQAKFTNCTAKVAVAGTSRALRVFGGNTGVVVVGFTAVGTNEGAVLDATSQSIIADSDLSGAATPVTDLSGITVFRNVLGYVNESTTTTAALAIDSTGRKTFTINHGLSSTPSIKNISCQITQTTGVTDARYGGVVIETVTPTQVTGSLYVSTASATGGATAAVQVSATAHTR